MSIAFLNMPFAIQKHIFRFRSVQLNLKTIALTMSDTDQARPSFLQRVNLFANRIFGARKKMRHEQEKNPRVQIFHNSCCEFDHH
jgi:hypothetical protein